MNKIGTISCIVIGGILLVAGLSIVELLLNFGTPIIGAFLAFILLVVAVVLLNKLRVKLKSERGIHSAVFICCSTLPALALDAVLYFIFNQVGGTSDWDILCFLFMLIQAVTAPLLLALLLVAMLISFLINKLRSKKATENKEEV